MSPASIQFLMVTSHPYFDVYIPIQPMLMVMDSFRLAIWVSRRQGQVATKATGLRRGIGRKHQLSMVQRAQPYKH